MIWSGPPTYCCMVSRRGSACGRIGGHRLVEFVDEGSLNYFWLLGGCRSSNELRRRAVVSILSRLLGLVLVLMSFPVRT